MVDPLGTQFLGSTFSSATIVIEGQIASGGPYTTITANEASDIVVTLNANPLGATLEGTLSQMVSQGQTTFSDLALDRPVSSYSLAFSSISFSDIMSDVFDVRAGRLSDIGSNKNALPHLSSAPFKIALQVLKLPISPVAATSIRRTLMSRGRSALSMPPMNRMRTAAPLKQR